MKKLILALLLCVPAFAQISGGGSGSGTSPFTSSTANPASTGILRCANNEACVSSRNAANSANLSITLNSSNIFAFDAGLSVAGSAGVNPSAAGTGTVGTSSLPWATMSLSGTSGTPASQSMTFTGLFTSVKTATFPNTSGTVSLTRTKVLTQCAATSSTTFSSCYGEATVSSAGGACTNVAADANNGTVLACATGAVIGNTNGVASGNASWRSGANRNLYVQFRGGLASTADVRFAAGFTDNSVSQNTMYNGDSPAANAAWFAYCNDAAAGCTVDDTNFQCKVAAGGAATKTSTGVAADTAVHLWEIQEDTTVSPVLWHFYIDGVKVCTMTTGTDNTPTVGTNMKWFFGIDTRVASAKTVNIGFIATERDK